MTLSARVMKRRFLVLSLFATSTVALGAGVALAATLPPEIAPIESLDSALIATMKAADAKVSFAERFDTLKPVLERVYDLPEILAISVGLFWSTLPPAQKTTLQSLFTEYTVATYVKSFDHFNGQRFEIQPTVRSLGARRIVTTNLIAADGQKTRLDYVMTPSSETWKITDVLFDGTISKVATQRSDFSGLVEPGNATRLIDALRKKITVLSGGALKVG